MKKILLLFSLFLFTHLAFSQSTVYHHFPDSNAVWREDYSNWSYPSSSWTDDSGYSYRLQGDTIINSKIYHKVYEEGGYLQFYPTGTAYYYHKYFAGAIREDTSKHVYLCCTKNLGTKDTLLYDFNLIVGDSLNQYNAGKGIESWYVDSIDSIQLNDSSYRKRFILNLPRATFPNAPIIIEGIGSSNGLLDQINLNGEIGTSLDCFKQNGKYLYGIYSDSCPLFYPIPPLSDVVLPIREPSISVYPNPASKNITVRLIGLNSKVSMAIYNVVGQQIWSTDEVMESAIMGQNISVEGFPAGIYLLKVITDKGETLVKKVEIVR